MVLKTLCFLCLSFAVIIPSVLAGEQVVHNANNGDSITFTPLGDFNAIMETQYTVLNHPEFPQYNVRIKKSNFCDGTVNAYTGYIDVEARHLFFYFFESRQNPDIDDVIFWTNGGPGGSSSFGLFMELGPCRVVGDNKTEFHPYGWNEYANVFFIDQPVGVGFSYADYGEYVSTTEEAAKDIAAFVAVFFEHFSKFQGRAFHMAGESYGGRYIPTYASEIFDQNTKLEKLGMTPINLTSIMIGNGCTEWATMIPSYYDMQCKNISAPPVVDISSCVRVNQIVPRCKKMLRESCDEAFDAINCRAAFEFCESNIGGPFVATGKNAYDLTTDCLGGLDDFCYPITRNITAYLNLPQVQRTLGVDPSKSNYSMYSPQVGQAFDASMDRAFPTQLYISALLERDIKVLIYVGANDWICNWVGNERMTLGLDWSGSESYVSQPLRPWKIDNTDVGLTRSHGPLTFATVFGAGHMAPYDKPIESLELLRRWLKEKEL